MTFIKRFFSALITLVLVAAIALTGCSNAGGLTGNYQQDTLAMVQALRTAIEIPDDAPDKAAAQAEARQKINVYAARYRRDPSVATLSSYTTIRTALNSLAGHYSSYPNRPLPQKLKDRLTRELTKAERALQRGY